MLNERSLKVTSVFVNSLTYRVSHSKVSKVILLWWGYRFQFLLILWILWVHGIGAFMPKSSIFIFLMLRALYGSISENLLFLNEFLFILTFSSLFRVIRSWKPLKKKLKVALHLLHSICFYQKIISDFYISSCRGRVTSKKWKLMN